MHKKVENTQKSDIIKVTKPKNIILKGVFSMNVIEKYLYIEISKMKAFKKYTFIEFTHILKTDFLDIKFDNALYPSLAYLCNIINI